DLTVTGVQTCALPIFEKAGEKVAGRSVARVDGELAARVLTDERGALGADDLGPHVIRVLRSPVRLDVGKRTAREPNRVERGIRCVPVGVAGVTEHRCRRRDARD